MTKRKVLLANVFFAPFTYGGATIVAEEVAKALLQLGEYDITVVSVCSRSDLAGYTVFKSEVNGITNLIVNLPAQREYVDAYDNPKMTEIFGELIDSISPELVHVHCLQDLGVGIVQAAHDRNIPSILSVHDFWWICERQFMIKIDHQYCGQSPVKIENCRGCVTKFERSEARFKRLQQIGEMPARVTFPSAFAKQLSRQSGFATQQSVIWENGVQQPGAGFFQAQKARRDGDQKLTFGFIGGPSQIKGWPIIRKAFQSLGHTDFRVILVDGSMDGSWWSDHDFSDLPGDWQVYPRFAQNEMDAFYAQIDVLLFMSQWKETFGLAIREALARGISLIQTDSGGTVEHAAAATQNLIPIGANPDALAAQIIETIDQHPSYAKPFQTKGYDDQAMAFHRLANEVLAS